MYIDETTAAERVTIRNAVDDVFICLENARFRLSEVVEDYFQDAEQKAIDRFDAERIAIKLNIVDAIMFESLLKYALTVGDGDYCGVTPHMESAERAMRTAKVEKLLWLMDTEERKNIMELPDEQAISILEKK